MPYRDLIPWTAMVAAFAYSGLADRAAQLFRALEMDGIEPNQISFTSILIACSHAGKLDLARQLLRLMIQDHEILPLREHFSLIVDGLGRIGQLRLAEEMIHAMPFVPDPVAYGALLGASKIHREDQAQARGVAQTLAKLDPASVTPYVTLSSIG
ncbi:hypothetical protein SELMODRAFT_111894 [Selaginella moellendorffii]|uniref:Pentacotripeptide-repeat region of PRORP domain-containing protein n=2 Tax=Selaginella moellendorffii TaxID=88036 RepID=D8S9R6_SELML|nr:hypothetical protein SELMODRAFT_111894 [Selaginella moellendorffii]